MLTSSELLIYKLTELANSEGDQIDGGCIEIYWENQNGQEFSTEESVPDIAQDALNRIQALESAIKQTIGWAESTGSLRPEDDGETLRQLKELVSYKPSLLEQDEANSEEPDLLDSLEFPCSDEEQQGARERLS